MRRATACFSMYSDMSMRTMADSSSKRNSARARAVSVLPTPVGPRKMKLPMGRLGSLRPARLRRMALATTGERGVLTMTRSAQAVLHGDELLHLAFEHLGDGGMPVHLETTAAMSSSSTSSLSIRAGFFPGLRIETWGTRFGGWVSLRSSASDWGISPYWSSAARCRLPLRGLLLCFESEGFEVGLQLGDASEWPRAPAASGRAGLWTFRGLRRVLSG